MNVNLDQQHEWTYDMWFWINENMNGEWFYVRKTYNCMWFINMILSLLDIIVKRENVCIYLCSSNSCAALQLADGEWKENTPTF